MKKYFSFDINPLKLLPLVFCSIILQAINYYNTKNLSPYTDGNYTNYLLLQAIIILANIPITYFIIRIYITGYLVDEKRVHFKGKLLTFIAYQIGYGLLSIFSMGLALPYYIKKINSFYINNTSVNDTSFKFNGTASSLFSLMILFLFLPLITTFILVYNKLIPAGVCTGFTYLGVFIFTVYLTRWLININYSGYTIKLNSTLTQDLFHCLIFIVVTICSLGLLFPFVAIWLYKYYINNLVAYKDEVEVVSFFEEFDILKDGGYLLGQILLTLITLGIYSPWATNNIGKRLVSKTGYINNSMVVLED